MIVSVTLNAAVDHLLILEGIKVHDTNRIKEIQTDAGGKGINLSRVVSSLGGETFATGFLGGGPGGYIAKVLEEEGVDHRFVWTREPTRTNFNVESGDGPPTTFNASGHHVRPDTWQRFLDEFPTLVAEADWVVLGGSIPPGIDKNAYAVLGKIAKDTGAKLVVDADGDAMRQSLSAAPDLIKPNVNEAARLLDRELENTDHDVLSASDDLFKLLETNGAKSPTVLISRGKNGAVLKTSEGRWLGRSPEVKAVSTIGSGDSMVAGFLFALMDGKSSEEAFAFGLAAGAATAQTDGTGIGQRDAILELLTKTDVQQAD